MFSFNLIFHSLFFFAEHSTLKLSHLQGCSIIYFFLGTFRNGGRMRESLWWESWYPAEVKQPKLSYLHEFSWEQPARSFTHRKVFDGRSEIKLFHDQNRAELHSLSDLALFSLTFPPSLSLSNSHPLGLLPNYSPLMRTSVGRKQNWEEVFLSQNKYFPELHNLNQPGSITYVALPESISCLYCIAIFFGKSTELLVLLF